MIKGRDGRPLPLVLPCLHCSRLVPVPFLASGLAPPLSLFAYRYLGYRSVQTDFCSLLLISPAGSHRDGWLLTDQNTTCGLAIMEPGERADQQQSSAEP